MNAPQVKPWKLPAIVGGALALGLMALAAWWWWKGQNAATGADAARLQAAVQRQQQLLEELGKAGPQNPSSCPPGQSLQLIPGTKAESGPGTSPQMPGMAGPVASGPAAGSDPPAVSSGGPPLAALKSGMLAQQLESATAIVIVEGDGTGTGFFIAPNLLITNRHVIENSSGKRVYLTSKALGSLRRASVLQATRSSDIGSPDFALLRMEDGRSAGVLTMASEAAKLSSVVAAGYPGVVLRNDTNFVRLLKGDLSAAPDLSLTQGAVQSLQDGSGGVPLIIHTAFIAQGNSGGPLVDGCGRVIGVNTFINVDAKQSAKTHYAIRSTVLSRFLQAASVPAALDGRPCT